MTEQMLLFFESLETNAVAVMLFAVFFRIWNPKVLFYDAVIILTIHIFLLCNIVDGDYWGATFDCLVAVLWLKVYKSKKEDLEEEKEKVGNT